MARIIILPIPEGLIGRCLISGNKYKGSFFSFLFRSNDVVMASFKISLLMILNTECKQSKTKNIFSILPYCETTIMIKFRTAFFSVKTLSMAEKGDFQRG